MMNRVIKIYLLQKHDKCTSINLITIRIRTKKMYGEIWEEVTLIVGAMKTKENLTLISCNFAYSNMLYLSTYLVIYYIKVGLLNPPPPLSGDNVLTVSAVCLECRQKYEI